MKRRVLIVICFIFMILVGCENNNKKPIVQEDESQNVINSLYTDENKLVYDNNGMKIVYYYSGDLITGLEYYYSYADVNEAKEQCEKANEEFKYNSSIKEIIEKGKFVVYVMNESEYKDTTVEDIKDSLSYLTPVYKR